MPRLKVVTKRPTYREAVAWIALNDNTAAGDSVETIAGYISTLLVADLFGAEPRLVAVDIERCRYRHGLHEVT